MFAQKKKSTTEEIPCSWGCCWTRGLGEFAAQAGAQRSSGRRPAARRASPPPALLRRPRARSFSLPSGSAARPAFPPPPHGHRLCPAGSHSSRSGQGDAVRCQEPRKLRPRRCINGFRVDRRFSRARWRRLTHCVPTTLWVSVAG